MHERTQKAICRLAFVACCAMPTFLVLLAIITTWTPWYHSRQLRLLESALTDQLGLRVELEDFARPAPSVLRLSGIVIKENETGAEVGRIRMATYAILNEKRVLRIHQPELQSAQLKHTWQIVHDRFLCQPELTRQPLIVAADDLSLHSSSGGVTLREVIARVTPEDQQIKTEIEFIPAGRESDIKAQVSIVRNRELAIPETRWQLHTGGVPLPCSALADYLPILRTLGEEAEFNGALGWNVSSEGWKIDLAGANFEGVDLSVLFDGLPHKLTGRATLKLAHCKITPGEMVDVSGSIVATRGYVDDSLLQAAETHLGIQSSVSDNQGSEWYDLLAFRFDLFGSKLSMHGSCHHQRGYESMPAGTILARGTKPLAGRQNTEAISSTNLVAALAPHHAKLVPFSSQTAAIGHLLIPSAEPLPDDVPPPSPRITLRPN
ncbi:hypothetical protein FF011L_49840 [Roseimaritima multifibrata]|uniref:AsmA-like C-terminal domain-containing protein n=2 Tax=Roseimaritima multifibrata TaxID=1930274 RepID=A0A517MMR4_9BACT|nr:hypothetical protein FF011L_49840 [Roseimaritima multifibrata]